MAAIEALPFPGEDAPPRDGKPVRAYVYDTSEVPGPRAPIGPYQVRCRCGYQSELFAEYWPADEDMCKHNREHWRSR